MSLLLNIFKKKDVPDDIIPARKTREGQPGRPRKARSSTTKVTLPPDDLPIKVKFGGNGLLSDFLIAIDFDETLTTLVSDRHKGTERRAYDKAIDIALAVVKSNIEMANEKENDDSNQTKIVKCLDSIDKKLQLMFGINAEQSSGEQVDYKERISLFVKIIENLQAQDAKCIIYTNNASVGHIDYLLTYLFGVKEGQTQPQTPHKVGEMDSSLEYQFYFNEYDGSINNACKVVSSAPSDDSPNKSRGSKAEKLAGLLSEYNKQTAILVDDDKMSFENIPANVVEVLVEQKSNYLPLQFLEDLFTKLVNKGVNQKSLLKAIREDERLDRKQVTKIQQRLNNLSKVKKKAVREFYDEKEIRASVKPKQEKEERHLQEEKKLEETLEQIKRFLPYGQYRVSAVESTNPNALEIREKELTWKPPQTTDGIEIGKDPTYGQIQIGTDLTLGRITTEIVSLTGYVVHIKTDAGEGQLNGIEMKVTLTTNAKISQRSAYYLLTNDLFIDKTKYLKGTLVYCDFATHGEGVLTLFNVDESDEVRTVMQNEQNTFHIHSSCKSVTYRISGVKVQANKNGVHGMTVQIDSYVPNLNMNSDESFKLDTLAMYLTEADANGMDGYLQIAAKKMKETADHAEQIIVEKGGGRFESNLDIDSVLRQIKEMISQAARAANVIKSSECTNADIVKWVHLYRKKRNHTINESVSISLGELVSDEHRWKLFDLKAKNAALQTIKDDMKKMHEENVSYEVNKERQDSKLKELVQELNEIQKEYKNYQGRCALEQQKQKGGEETQRAIGRHRKGRKPK